MSAAIVAAARVPLTAITASNTNPRKRFDQAKLDELADSIKRHDVLQPVLLRPNSQAGKYELVAGERRFRAAQAAGLADIPATVRELSDSEVLEIQVVENLQRSDLHELEEAEGYERLLRCVHSDGTRYTVDEIAAKVGKSRSYVFARLKLTALCPEGREAFQAGTINASIALLVARIPVASLQARAVEEITKPDWQGETMSFRRAKDHLEEHYMLRLKEAPFDTKVSYLVRIAGSLGPVSAPPCGECPKRTGNQPELFSDIASADVCTDPECFDAKKAEHAALLVAAAQAKGRTVITGKEAKKIMPHSYSQPKGYVRLDACCYEDPKSRTYRALLGKAATDAVLLEVPGAAGDFVEVLPEDQVAEILKKKGYDFAATKEEQRHEDAKEDRLREIEREACWRTYLAWRAAVAKDGLGAEDVRAMLYERIEYADVDDRVLAAWGLSEEQIAAQVDLHEVIEHADPAALVPMLLDLAFTRAAYGDDEGWAHLAKARGVDRKAIERAVRAEFKATAKNRTAEAVEA